MLDSGGQDYIKDYTGAMLNAVSRILTIRYKQCILVGKIVQ